MAIGRISDDLPNLVLRIESTVSLGIIGRGELAFLSVPPFQPVRIGTISGVGGQLRIFLALDTPASRVGQVEMQSVHLIISHHVKKFEYLFFGEEVT